MQRLIDFLFAVAIVLVFGLILFVGISYASIPKASEVLRQTTVRIEGLECIGSGSVVEGKAKKRYILTNAHVCSCAKWKGNIYATYDSGRLIVGHVVKQDWSSDLCLAQIGDDVPALHIGHDELPLMEITTRGYPGGRLAESHGRVHGEVGWDYAMDIAEIGACPPNSRKQYGHDDHLKACIFHFTSVVSDLYVRPGASGSPVVDNNGDLVGVVSSFLSEDIYEAGMVPLQSIRKLVGSL